MTEIWQECVSFQTTSQRLGDQVRMIIKKGWFSDLDILEIHQIINNEQDNNTLLDTLRIIKQKQPNKNKLQTSENGNASRHNNAQPNNQKETPAQEQKKI